MTVLLALGVHFVESHFSPLIRLLVSLFFGAIWIASGIRTSVFRAKGISKTHQTAEQTARMIGMMFLIFGIIWIGISVYQYRKPPAAKQNESPLQTQGGK